jgi:hypothetical protein
MQPTQSTLEPPEAPAIAQQLVKLVAALPEDAALEVLHFAEYMALRAKAEDARWDALFSATTDAQWDALIAGWMHGEATGIAVKDDELVPVPLSNPASASRAASASG